jgi:hypothetical protein
MSSTYVGSSGSDSGASSSGRSGGDSALTQNILGSVANAGEEVGISAVNLSLQKALNQTPPSQPTAVAGLGSSSMTTWIIVIVVLILGVFAFREL